MSEDVPQNSILSVYWSDLAPHYRRGALWIFAFDLQQAARAVSEDQTRIIQAWIDSGDLRKPTQEEILGWTQCSDPSKDTESEKLHEPQFYFHAVIIQPFVIMNPNPLIVQPTS
tara:strand:- start:223 stop:564 length:342 start_codon:yes stop_codon:yes gene_type:complete